MIGHLGLYVLGAAVIVSLAFAGIGIARVARTGLRLKARVEAYGDLSVVKVLELTEARVDAAQRRALGIPRLMARAQSAVVDINAAVLRVRAIVETIRFFVRKMLSAG